MVGNTYLKQRPKALRPLHKQSLLDLLIGRQEAGSCHSAGGPRVQREPGKVWVLPVQAGLVEARARGRVQRGRRGGVEAADEPGNCIESNEEILGIAYLTHSHFL